MRGAHTIEPISLPDTPALVPLVDDFVASFDEDARAIELSAPAGLFDLQ